MSRSRKKVFVCKDNIRSSKSRKRIANKRFRHAPEVFISTGKPGIYKRYTNSWDIHDYILRWTKEEAIQSWYNEENTCANYGWDIKSYGWHRHYANLKEFLNKGWAGCVYYK